MLAIIHGRLDLVPNSALEFYNYYGHVSDILVVADKYNVTHFLSPWAPTWLAHAKDPWGAEYLQVMQRLHIAWELGSAEKVAAIIKYVIFDYSEENLEGLLAYAEQCPSLGFSSVLADILSNVK